MAASALRVFTFIFIKVYPFISLVILLVLTTKFWTIEKDFGHLKKTHNFVFENLHHHRLERRSVENRVKKWAETVTQLSKNILKLQYLIKAENASSTGDMDAVERNITTIVSGEMNKVHIYVMRIVKEATEGHEKTSEKKLKALDFQMGFFEGKLEEIENKIQIFTKVIENLEEQKKAPKEEKPLDETGIPIAEPPPLD